MQFHEGVGTLIGVPYSCRPLLFKASSQLRGTHLVHALQDLVSHLKTRALKMAPMLRRKDTEIWLGNGTEPFKSLENALQDSALDAGFSRVTESIVLVQSVLPRGHAKLLVWKRVRLPLHSET